MPNVQTGGACTPLWALTGGFLIATAPDVTSMPTGTNLCLGQRSPTSWLWDIGFTCLRMQRLFFNIFSFLLFPSFSQKHVHVCSLCRGWIFIIVYIPWMNISEDKGSVPKPVGLTWVMINCTRRQQHGASYCIHWVYSNAFWDWLLCRMVHAMPFIIWTLGLWRKCTYIMLLALTA